MLGGIVFVVFAALFLRLWALQVLSGTRYVAQAQANQYRTVRVQARRGPILDRNGKLLVTNAAATAVELWSADLPKNYRDRYFELKELATVTRVPLYEIAAKIKARKGDPVTPVVVRDNAPTAMATYLYERSAAVPGCRPGARLRAALPVPLARRAGARLRRRDLAAAAAGARLAGLPGRGRDRPGGHRVDVRQLPARRRRLGARAGRLARPAAQRPPGDDARDAGPLGPAHARPRAPEGGRERAPVRDLARAVAGPVGGPRRRDRRHGPERRLDSRARLLAELRPVRLHRPRQRARARRGGPDPEDGARRRTSRRSTGR